MTKRQTRIYKLGNAMRARRGGLYYPPQKMAALRVERWLNRCREHGDLAAEGAQAVKNWLKALLQPSKPQ